MFKKIFYIMLIFGVIFSVSLVCAADSTMNLTQIEENDEISIEENQVISQANTQKINEENKPVISLEEKIQKGYGSNITLDCDYETSKCINIEKSITIDGKGHTIDAKGQTRIFNIKAANVILKNITFKNAKAIGHGGAIFWKGSNGVVSNCIFENNTITDVFCMGGAIYWEGNNGQISNSNFTKNCAEGVGSMGGAISWEGNNGQISNSIFTENSAIGISSVVGAILWLSDNGNISNCIFEKNNATADSAIRCVSDNSIINNNIFLNNNGPIMDKNKISRDKNLFVHDKNIEHKTNKKGTFSDLNKLINNNKEDIIILDMDYEYDPTTDYNFKNGININRKVTIIGNYHIINGAEQARIFNIKANNVKIENIAFIKAKSTENGGAINWLGINGNVSGCIFLNNEAKNGGAIAWTLCNNYIVSDCIFINNYAEQDGGAIAWYYGTTGGIISKCIFMKNHAGSNTNTIWSYSSPESTISDSIFVDNE